MAEFHPVARPIRLILRGPVAGATVLGLTLPRDPCRSVDSGDTAALWLGPDEFLLLGLPPAEVAAALGATPHACIDVSDRDLTYRLSGPDAATLLSGAVPLDLSAAAFPIGMCARTIFERAEILLWRRGVTVWEIAVARSFAAYVSGMLAAIAAADGISLVGQAA